MLARVPNPSRNDTEYQEDSQGNSLMAGVEQVCDDVELTVESLNETDGLTGGVILDQCSKSKGKRKAANCPDSSAKKAKNWAWMPEAVEVLGFRGFVGRDSPGDNPTHVNGGYLLTLLGGLPSLHVNRALH